MGQIRTHLHYCLLNLVLVLPIILRKSLNKYLIMLYMDFYYIVIIVLLGLLIIALTLYGIFYAVKTNPSFPYIQDTCPKQWSIDGSGNCINICPSGNVCTNLGSTTSILSVPGTNGVNGFNSADPGWASYSGAKSSICGKQKWSIANNIDWNGVTTYTGC